MSDSEPAAKRCRKNWIQVDTMGMSIEEYFKKSKYKWTKSSNMSGKQYYKCKLYHRFGCKHQVRTFMIENAEVLEECGNHICNDSANEIVKAGLPQRVKKEVIKILDDTPNTKPGKIFERIIFREQDKHAFKEKQIRNYVRSMNRQKNKKNKFYRETVEGVKKWVEKHRPKNDAIKSLKMDDASKGTAKCDETCDDLNEMTAKENMNNECHEHDAINETDVITTIAESCLAECEDKITKNKDNCDDFDVPDDPNDLFVIKLNVSAEKCHVVFTTKNMLRMMAYPDLQVCLDSTFRCLWNRWPFHIMGRTDKHHHFHPVGYMFGSNEDADSYAIFLDSLNKAYFKIFGETPHAKCSMNDNADAIFKAVSEVYPESYMQNCYAHLVSRNIQKYTKKLTRSDKLDVIRKQLLRMGSLAYSVDFERAVTLFRNEYNNSEPDFMKAFDKEYLSEHKGHWSFSYLKPGTPRSNNGLEGYNGSFKERVLKGEPMNSYDFLSSLEEHIIVKSTFCHEKYVSKVSYYDVDMCSRRKDEVRKMYEKAFNETFYFTSIYDVIVVPSEKNRKNGITEEEDIKGLYEKYLATPQNESLDEFLRRCLSCWILTRNVESDFSFDCTCPTYCLYGMCKHVIRYSVDNGMFEIPDGLDFRPLKPAAKRGKPKKKSGKSYEWDD
jgi:hypothetical protein